MPSLSSQANDARTLAESFLVETNRMKLPVDPFEIAKSLDIAVSKIGPDSNGCSGMLLRHGNNFGILYATHVPVLGYQRFSVAHELGHYLLPGHTEHVGNQHISYIGLNIPRDRYEIEANNFAAGLLIPRPLMGEVIDPLPFGMKRIDALSDACITSTTATAINYAKYINDPVIAIFSSSGVVEYAYSSPLFFKQEGFRHLRKGDPVPLSSATANLAGFYYDSETSTIINDQADAEDWKFTPSSQRCIEEVRDLGQYGKLLTVLTIPS